MGSFASREEVGSGLFSQFFKDSLNFLWFSNAKKAQLFDPMAIINDMAPYYGSGPLFDPATMQRVDRPFNPGRSGIDLTEEGADPKAE